MIIRATGSEDEHSFPSPPYSLSNNSQQHSNNNNNNVSATNNNNTSLNMISQTQKDHRHCDDRDQDFGGEVLETHHQQHSTMDREYDRVDNNENSMDSFVDDNDNDRASSCASGVNYSHSHAGSRLQIQMSCPGSESENEHEDVRDERDAEDSDAEGKLIIDAHDQLQIQQQMKAAHSLRDRESDLHSPAGGKLVQFGGKSNKSSLVVSYYFCKLKDVENTLSLRFK